MKEQEQPFELPKQVRVAQIIVLALAAGVSVYFGYVLIQQNDPIDPDSLIPYIAMGFAGVATMLSLVVPPILANNNIKSIADGKFTGVQGVSSDDEKLAAVYQIKMIFGCAILEGAGLFNAYAYSTGSQFANAVIVVLLILGVLLHFPTVGRITNWLEQRKHDLEFMRK